MTYILHGDRRSGSCIVELALGEIGAHVELRDVSLEHDTQRSEHYASLNPSRKVPSLITPEGEILTESVAILLTLDERHRQAALLPPPGIRNAPRRCAGCASSPPNSTRWWRSATTRSDSVPWGVTPRARANGPGRCGASDGRLSNMPCPVIRGFCQRVFPWWISTLPSSANGPGKGIGGPGVCPV
jgi:hypothetical protein